MDEAQLLASRVAVMRDGEIVASGRPDELGGRDLRPAEIRFALPPGYSPVDFPAVPATSISTDGDRVVVATTDPVRAAHLLTAHLPEAVALRLRPAHDRVRDQGR
jgi:ABC-2 type transport system ATP-binding protein